MSGGGGELKPPSGAKLEILQDAWYTVLSTLAAATERHSEVLSL